MCNRAKEGTLRLTLSVTCFLGWNLFYCIEVFSRLLLTATNTARTEELKKDNESARPCLQRWMFHQESHYPGIPDRFRRSVLLGKLFTCSSWEVKTVVKIPRSVSAASEEIYGSDFPAFFLWDPIKFSIEGTFSCIANLSRLTVSQDFR